MYRCEECEREFEEVGGKAEIQGYTFKYEVIINCCPFCGSENYAEKRENE